MTDKSQLLYRDPERFFGNWETLLWKGHDPFQWLSLREGDGTFDVILRDYVDFDTWFAPADKPYKTREQAFAALGRLLDKEAAKPEALSVSDIRRMRNA